ncbi:MAG: hypothetical protein NTY75_04290 [Candidatus Shapirobacteria bacterium]|nr:hypothetical protein [Candidatus Shapirobacteria bacterium]
MNQIDNIDPGYSLNNGMKAAISVKVIMTNLLVLSKACNSAFIDSFRPKKSEVSTEGKRTKFRRGIRGRIFLTGSMAITVSKIGIFSSLTLPLLSVKREINVLHYIV